MIYACTADTYWDRLGKKQKFLQRKTGFHTNLAVLKKVYLHFFEQNLLIKLNIVQSTPKPILWLKPKLIFYSSFLHIITSLLWILYIEGAQWSKIAQKVITKKAQITFQVKSSFCSSFCIYLWKLKFKDHNFITIGHSSRLL